MDIGAAASTRKVDTTVNQPGTSALPAPPPMADIRSFAKGMGSGGASSTGATEGMAESEPKSDDAAVTSDQKEAQLQQLMGQLIQLIQQLIQSMQQPNAQGASIAGPGGQVSSVNPPSVTGNADAKIPKPTEHVQTLNLGGKPVTVGGDGTASAAEVQSTAATISNLYQNSPTFKNMIDNSSDPSFEVSVGRRSDNTSWGAGDGRLFMNINNVAPDNNDTFQSLLGHEFAHASIDLGHGGEMEQLQARVAQEA